MDESAVSRQSAKQQ